ncbi:MFS transporter [Alkalihalobacillus sp. BA299]|uniref:MFS transporter n=1 Tax=Alkalihalobacillus sp. BA299 TaxID=2815938 RepID=UPI001AD9D9D1|nr:MFS transporter [Alkalihalobacillus sp. BA299]
MNRKLILYTKALSDFGMFMDLIVLNVIIYAATGSTVWLAATMAARTIGGVLSSLFSGVLADRFNRRKIMIISDFLRAGIILALIPFPNPTMIILASFFIGFVNSSFMVSFSAEIPQIFGEKNVLPTNALIARLTSISLVSGFLAAAIITDYLGYKLTLLIDAATYLISGIVLLKVKWDSPIARTKEIAIGVSQKLKSVWTDIIEVYSYLIVAPMLMFVNIVFLVGAFAGSSHNLGIPLLAEDINPVRQSFYYGLIWAVWGVGSVFATYTLPKLPWLKGQKIYFTCFISAILMSTGFIIFLSGINIWIILLFAFITGIFDACFTTLHATILQRTENHIRGRIFGVGMLLKSLGFAGGFVVAPWILSHMTMPQMVWLMHGTLITVTLFVLGLALGIVTRGKKVTETKEVS